MFYFLSENLTWNLKLPEWFLAVRVQKIVFFYIKLTSKYKPLVCALKTYNLNSRETFEPGPEFESGTSRSLAWRSYHLRYPGSIEGTRVKVPLKINAIQALWSVTLSIKI